jgi:hypothetical protein
MISAAAKRVGLCYGPGRYGEMPSVWEEYRDRARSDLAGLDPNRVQVH